MIKLGGLINLKPITEADVFTATSKETGTTSVFKSKAARDAAIKAGTHEKRKDDKDGGVKDPTDKPKGQRQKIIGTLIINQHQK